ncbi:Transposase [Janthinobacterium sp. CG23_2]|nr:Transposase [Janthinobacterium sp. CG23_2]CUU30030.1 Transposase [Janthinobacterium sp. CG23_2]
MEKNGQIEVTCIVAREIDAPAGSKPVEWRLLTKRVASTLEDATELIDWYHPAGKSKSISMCLRMAAKSRNYSWQQLIVAELALADMYHKTGGKQRMIGEFDYAARSWNRERRVIARLEHDAHGRNPRFVVTNLKGGPKALYERVYCARGEAENRIKEAQLDLFGRRASCHKFQSNQLRLLLAAFAYTLMINLRRLALGGTELARACTATIRIKLLKIGAAIVRNTRRVRVLLASQHPLQHVFLSAARALAP